MSGSSGPAGEELQGEVGVGGAAHAEVDLEGGELPLLRGVVAVDEEVDAEAAHDAVRGEHVADLQPRLLDLHPVVVAGREAAAEEDLAARPAEDLVVGRDRHHVPARADAELGARRELLLRLDELLDDAAHPGELVEVGLRASPRAPRTRARGSASRRAARSTRLRVAEEGVALPGEAVVELDDGPADARPPRPRSSSERLHDLVRRVQVLEALGERSTPASRKTLRLPDFVPRWASAGSQPFSGMPRRTASLRSRGVELKTVR